MRQVDVPRFDLRTHRAGPSFLPAFRIDRNQTLNLVFESGDHGRAVRLVLDQLAARERPASGGRANGIEGLRKIKTLSYLIEEEAVGVLLPPYLPDHEVA